MKGLAVLLLFTHSVAVGAERPDDFAFGMPIQTGAQSALYEVEIPLAVYRGVVRNDLGDLRVFNGAGEAVPHAMKPPESAHTVTVTPIELPVFPLRGFAEKIEPSHVRIQRRADGTIVSIDSRPQAEAPARTLRAYLIDASAVKASIQSLHLDWKTDRSGGFVGQVKIEGSDDLNSWKVVNHRAALARLNFGGFTLNQDRVDLGGAAYKYLRLSWPEEQKPLESLTARAQPTAGVVPAPRRWQAIEGAAPGKTREYTYDLGGPVPYDRLRVELPQVNSVAQIQVLARTKPGGDWRLKTSATVYRLRRGDAEVSSPELAVSGGGETQLQLRVDQKGGVIGSGVPLIHIGWSAQKLVFAARGNGPFHLAYGNAAAKPAAFAIDALIPGYRTDAPFAAEPASLGKPVTLAGRGRLRTPVDYKKWTLWIVLVIGVAMLGFMAYRLVRQVSRVRPQSQESQSTDKSD